MFSMFFFNCKNTQQSAYNNPCAGMQYECEEKTGGRVCKRWLGGGGGSFSGLLQQLVGCWAGFHGNMEKKKGVQAPSLNPILMLYKRITFYNYMPCTLCVSLSLSVCLSKSSSD